METRGLDYTEDPCSCSSSIDLASNAAAASGLLREGFYLGLGSI